MSARAKPLRFSDALRRVVAAGCAGLVLALTLFAASPRAHDWVHCVEKQQGANGDATSSLPASAATGHDCAVVLFASGVDLPVGPVSLLPPRVVAQGISPVTAAEFYLVSPRYLRQPERGPPMRLI